MPPFLSKAQFQLYHVGVTRNYFIAFIQIKFELTSYSKIVEIGIGMECWSSQQADIIRLKYITE